MFAEQLSIEDYTREFLINLSQSDIKVTVDNNSVSKALTQIKSLHNDDDGYITIALKREGSWFQYHYKEAEIEENIEKILSLEEINVYISGNSFYKPFRKIENVRKLNALYIDLDYYVLEKFNSMTPEQIIYELDQEYFKRKVPEASFIVITGRGIAIYWLIESVPYMAIPLWSAIQNFFLQELKDIGADPKSIDAARVMRLAGSVNQKNGKSADVLIYNADYKYSLREIQEQYMPALTDYVKNPALKKKGRKAKVVKMFTVYSLHYSRLLDIVKLQEMRNGYCRNAKGELINTGQREFICFLYRYWSCCFTGDSKKAIEDTLEFNKGFALPLGENEVIRATTRAEKAYEEWKYNDFNLKKKSKITEEELKKSIEIKNKRKMYKLLGYNYTNKSLIKLLCITREEMKELKTIIDGEEVKFRTNERTKEIHKKERRNEKGLTKREQNKIDRINLITELQDKGYTQIEISQELNLSIRTIKRYCKYMK